MKKAFVWVMMGILAVSMLAGCGKKETEPVISQPVEESVAEPEPEPEEPKTPEGMARSYLTGEWIDENIAAQRPVAVMLGNTKIATPQYGITDADVIYESAVEGQETRLMGIFQDYANLEKVMSIRSCRHYYVHWALEFDAIYAHYGQAKYAVELLSQDYVNNLSGLDGSLEGTMYKRDSGRKAPHNAYTTGEGIVAGIQTKGYETKHASDYTGHYNLSSAGHWDSAPLPMVSPDEKVFIDLKEKISTLSERGVTIFFLPPPYCRSSFQNDSLAINRISESLKAIGFPYYLEPSGCVYPDSMFYDSRYHLIREGVVMHSRKIAGELKRTL